MYSINNNHREKSHKYRYCKYPLHLVIKKGTFHYGKVSCFEAIQEKRTDFSCQKHRTAKDPIHARQETKTTESDRLRKKSDRRKKQGRSSRELVTSYEDRILYNAEGKSHWNIDGLADAAVNWLRKYGGGWVLYRGKERESLQNRRALEAHYHLSWWVFIRWVVRRLELAGLIVGPNWEVRPWPWPLNSVES